MDAPAEVWVETPADGPRNAYLHCGSWPGDRTKYTRADLVEARIAEAVKAEREACAEIADKQAAAWADSMTAFHGVPSATRIATAIRARGNQ